MKADEHIAPALPVASSDGGAMARLFIVEAVSPGQARDYKPDQKLSAMRLMRRVIENRLKDPKLFGARNAVNETDIIRARNQFAGFSQ